MGEITSGVTSASPTFSMGTVTINGLSSFEVLDIDVMLNSEFPDEVYEVIFSEVVDNSTGLLFDLLQVPYPAVVSKEKDKVKMKVRNLGIAAVSATLKLKVISVRF